LSGNSKDWGKLQVGDKVRIRTSFPYHLDDLEWEEAVVIRPRAKSHAFPNHPLLKFKDGRGMAWSPSSSLLKDDNFAKEDMDIIGTNGYYFYLTDDEEWEHVWYENTKLGKLL
jgi:hypothetical protein